VAGIRHALAVVGAPPLPDATLQSFLGPPLVDSFATLPDFDAARVTGALTAYRSHYDPVAAPLFPGVLDVVAQLHAAGLALALATSKPQPFADQVVDAHGLRPFLTASVGWDDAAGRRSKADCVGAALRALGRPRAAVMVGDRIHDVEGAAAHGVPCIGVGWGYAPAGELAAAAAVVDTPTQLLGLLIP
jgi:phosphoglycolate phosphatase